MEECGVRGPLNSWFRDYLTARTYRVRVGESLSEPATDVLCGLPQGSGCGPVGYLMHVNSLCRVLRHATAYMFADDLCTIHASGDIAEISRLVQEDVDNIVKWSHDNGIILNIEKTKMLIIKSPYCSVPDIHCSIITHSYDCLHKQCNCICKPIERVNCVTYLGMQIDENFNWRYHIEKLCDKMRVMLCKFYNLQFKVPQKVLRCLYMALIDSMIGYGLECYGLTFKTYIEKIEIIQIRFLKLIVGEKLKIRFKDNYKELFKICNVLPASEKHKYLLATVLLEAKKSNNTKLDSKQRYIR
ncbi:uncharacterized protein LOC131841473 [Achroia grisella]|uniref:uncharacterized protein LOC131841473 n=1 Tax=Achroia grisella TaxID=688607 RepID=UPI0027D2E2FA|nr:uncharacterized protein LOC131841473 [Achroia grisella]